MMEINGQIKAAIEFAADVIANEKIFSV